MTALTAAHLRALVARVSEKRSGAGVIGIHAPEPWTGPPRLRVGEEEFEIVACRSVLEIREKLSRRGNGNGDPPLVLVTTLPETELGDDVRARLARQKLFEVQSWEFVRDLFRARHIDPRLAREGWIADALLEAAPPGGYPPVPTGVLDRGTVWHALLSTQVGLDAERPDALTLLHWTTERDKAERYGSAPGRFRSALRDWLAETAGDVGLAVLDCLDAGFGADALALGIVCGVLFHPEAERTVGLVQAATRFERFLGDRPIKAEVGRSWADASQRIVADMVSREGKGAAAPWLERAEAILNDIQASSYAHLSDVLASGFEARLERYGRALTETLRGAGGIEELSQAVGEARRHRLARQNERLERVEMSLRLARWLGASGSRRAPARSLVEAAAAYAREGAFVDWARSALRGGDSAPLLGAAYGELLARATELREEENRRFGELLAGWSEAGSSPDAAIPIEDVLARVVVPLARQAPVLLVVVDGMSCAVFRELLGDLGRRGWAPLLPAEETATWKVDRLPGGVVLAALPTVTEVCRATLLSGKLASGGSTVEKRNFAEHAGLVAVSKPRHPPLLFHKGDLVDPGGAGLSESVRTEIASSERQVVGVVLNAVDDHLLKSDQVRPLWTADYVHFLPALLYEAQAAGRVVILASDHGHIFEMGTELRKSEQGDRWRADDGSCAPGEVVIGGRRIDPSKGRRLIAPWSEKVRYGGKKNGYHGGVSPQEAIVPLAVLAPPSLDLEGWAPTALFVPAWWEDEQPLPVVPPAPAKRGAKPTAVQGTLFAETTRPRPLPSWIDELLFSATFAAQKAAAGRILPADEKIRAFLAALDERGGKLTRTALGQKLGLPPVRVPGTVAAMRRLLNVEGYDVLAVDEASDSVELKLELLRVQFELKG